MKVKELLEGEITKLPIKDLGDIFASQIYNIVRKDIGVEFAEKPGYFSDINPDNDEQITEVQLRKLQNILSKKNIPQLKEYPSKKIYGHRGSLDQDRTGFGPLTSHQWLPKEGTFIIRFDNDHRYLVDTSGAKSYIRMWLRIKEAK